MDTILQILKDLYKPECKLVKQGYLQERGLHQELEKKGYKTRWVKKDKIEEYKLKNYEIAYFLKENSPLPKFLANFLSISQYYLRDKDDSIYMKKKR